MSTSTAAAEVWQRLVQLPTRQICKRYQRAAGCDRSRATAVLHEYKRLLVLKVLASDFDDERLAAPPAVHQMWREHIVDTAAYADHCRTIAGRPIHHSPEADEVDEELARRAHRSAAAYRAAFGEPPPPTLWDFGELPELGRDELAALDAPAPKRARSAGAASTLSVSVQAPYLPLRTVQVGAEATVQQLFGAFVDSAGATHLVAGRNSVPPTTRLRHGNDWLHDLTPLAEAGVKEGSVVYVACPQERQSRDQLAVTVRDVAGGESASVFVRASQSVSDLMAQARTPAARRAKMRARRRATRAARRGPAARARPTGRPPSTAALDPLAPPLAPAAARAQAQDALGVPADCQQLIFAGKLLSQADTLAAKSLVEGSTVQMAVGRRREKEATMSPGGTWR